MSPEKAVHELSLTRIIDAPREKLFRAWTDGELMKEWFCPKPWRVSETEIDLRAGGANRIVMNGPAGEEVVNRGVYLEVVPNEKLVFTDAFTSAWVPSEKPFMVAIVTFEDLGGGRTRYTAICRHWSEEDRQAHEAMGFHEGWGICADQLADLAKRI